MIVNTRAITNNNLKATIMAIIGSNPLPVVEVVVVVVPLKAGDQHRPHLNASKEPPQSEEPPIMPSWRSKLTFKRKS
jgi:hypothetical protein